MVLRDSLLSFFHSPFFSAHAHTHTHYLCLHLYSLSLARCLQFFISSDFPPSLSSPPLFHRLFVIPASGHPLTAMMTSFSVLREVSLLANLNGSLWWPRYGSQSSQCAACEAVFNMIISLTSPQVVDWMGVFAESCFFAIQTSVSVPPTPTPPGSCLI